MSMLMKFARLALVAAPLAAYAAAAPAQDAAAGDPENGAKVFRKCAACHSLDPSGKSRFGPDLYGVIGRTTGTVEGFDYSEVMATAGAEGHVWTEEELSAFLENPKKAFPGTKMTFVGLKKPEERADVIAYIAQVSSGG
jgi:cytochrome c